MAPRQTLTISLDDPLGYFNDDEVEMSLIDVIARLQNALEQVPEEFRAKAMLRLRGGSDYSLRVSIFYVRPETDEELGERQKKNMAERQRLRTETEEQERRLLARLKAKYER